MITFHFTIVNQLLKINEVLKYVIQSEAYVTSKYNYKIGNYA